MDILAGIRGAFRRKYHIKKNENGADGDGGVGDVEGGVAVCAEPDFEKIGDCAVDDAVGEIAGGSADEERETGERAPSDGLAGDEEPGESGDEGKRQSDKRDTEQRRFGIGEHAESDARVDAVNYVDEV